ncbi:hypothetical protein LUZ61_014719 [Rhynchospora tenuis]|uniref:Uncharacterized protein n=1 Tax=Rhynchospora tenuis TaxID=198213 RepID=A0AAD5WB90_9POAL|nr:hypothetical protein LUZ61_014719 [Rhynchospora tenuis]
MGMTRDVIRSSINGFFKGYNAFTTIAAIFVFPASLSVLLSESLIPSSTSVVSALSIRLRSLFQAAGFPETKFFSLLNIKLSQTIFSFCMSLPFTLTFLLLAKSCVIQIFRDSPRYGQLVVPHFSKFLPIYPSLFSTHIFSIFVFLSSNVTSFSLLFVLFNCADLFGLKSDTSVILLSAIGAIVYSVFIATTTVICNLATIISGMENCDGYMSILKACILTRGRIATALALALPTNIGMTVMEALFQFRIMRQYRISGNFSPAIMWEAFSITYIHSVLMVFEIIVSCMYYRRCMLLDCTNGEEEFVEEWRELQPEDKASFLV